MIKMRKRPIPYTVEPIDRRAELRKDHNVVNDILFSEKSLIIPLLNDQNLTNTNHGQLELCKLQLSSDLINNGKDPVFLGEQKGTFLFSIEYSDSNLNIMNHFAQSGHFKDLRTIGSSLSPIDASLAVYSRGMQYWHRTHQFCSRCGRPTHSTEGGHSRTCTNNSCSHVTYPRISPAAIVLVEHYPADGSAPMCLLGKGNRSWGNIRSTLAGFTEVGESLEETVKREMFEEAGIRVNNIRYKGSQPWPFPSSLMVGFFAETDETHLVLEEDEILAADWYTIDRIEKELASGELVLSREDSIARFLIESWINEVSCLKNTY